MSKEFHGCIQAFNVGSFYGVKNKPVKKVRKDEEISKSRPLIGLPHRLNNLLGPSQVWKVFKKQSDALEFAKKLRNGLMTFAFQQSDGQRLFLVAHPQIFWHNDIQKNHSERCAYEVIPESTVSKLYFDIEFDTKYNLGKDGPATVNTFITVIVYFLSTLFNVKVDKENVLNLDSSTESKFSRHLIFQLGSLAFSNNKSVGDFVNFVCKKLELCIDPTASERYLGIDKPKADVLADVCECCKLLHGCIKQIGLSSDTLNSLIVLDKKGNKRLICDLSVYSKNRHFRIFQNTKWGKNSPLEISDDNNYPAVVCKEKKDNRLGSEIYLETVFLDSLITYFRTPKDIDDVNVIDFKTYFMFDPKSTDTQHDLTKSLPNYSKANEDISINQSLYPLVDKFINALVFPGQIWKKTYFNTTSVIVYDIIGNRYCNNIKREHQSNNVKYIVNLNTYVYYQKCHDPECSSFRSEAQQLPPEIKFQLEDDLFDISDVDTVLKEVESSHISDSDLIEAASIVEDLSVIISDDE